MRRLAKFSPLLLAVVAGAVFVVPYAVPWTPLNCRHEDVDLRTGRIRYSRYLGFCKVSERVEDSTLTNALPREMVEGILPDWRRVNTFSPGVHHSPHYRFHAVIQQIRMLALIWQRHDWDDATRRKTATHVVRLWQHEDSDFLSGRYLSGLEIPSNGDDGAELIRTINQLEMPTDRIDGKIVTRTFFYPGGRPMERTQGFLAADGHFVGHGIWELWHFNGKRELYGHLDNGTIHGVRFNWDEKGILTSIQAFDHDHLTEFESRNLTARKDYKTAQELASSPLH